MLESLSNKVADTPTQVFSCEYCEIFKNTYFEKHLQTAGCRKRKKVWESMRERESMGIGLNNSEEP